MDTLPLLTSKDGKVPSYASIAPVEPKYKLYPIRWLVLAVVLLLQIANAMQEMMFSTIADSAATYYRTSTDNINILVLEYLVLYIPMGFIVPWMLSRYGLRTNFLIAATGNAIGSFGKYAITFCGSSGVSLAFAYVFQAINSLVQVIIVSCPTLFVALWFGESERVLANMIASVCGSIGLVVVSMTAPLIVPQSDPSSIPTLLWILAIPSVLGLVLVVLFVKDKPPTPPSPSANEETDAFLPGVKKLIRNKRYLVLMIAFGALYGSVSSILTLMEQIMASVNYSDQQTGLVSAIMYGTGLIGATVVGFIVDSTKRFKESLKICAVLAVASCVLLVVTLEPNSYSMVLISSSLIGISAFALIPVALEVSVECSYPVNEGTSAGFLWVSVQVFSAITLELMDLLKGAPNYFDETDDSGSAELVSAPDMKRSLWFMVGCVSAAALLMMFFRTDYLRLEAEKASKEEKVALPSSVNTFADSTV
eukprot:m.145532 g.145532  ORF g.145532 m.145532 type:complete len:479 (-) comp52679_c0_seq2:90-1526(-)